MIVSLLERLSAVQSGLCTWEEATADSDSTWFPPRCALSRGTAPRKRGWRGGGGGRGAEDSLSLRMCGRQDPRGERD